MTNINQRFVIVNMIKLKNILFENNEPNPTHAGVVLARKDEEGNIKILLVHGTGWRWQLPRGKIEEGETPIQAAERELQEETNIDISHVANMRSITIVDTSNRGGTVCEYFAAEDKENLYHPVNDFKSNTFIDRKTGEEKPENDEAGFFSIEEAKTMLQPNNLKAIEAFELNLH